MNKLTKKQTRLLKEEVTALATRLGPVTAKMRKAAIASKAARHWGVHYESTGDNLCQHCGHRWNDPSLRMKIDWWGSQREDRTVTCPHCHSRLRLDTSFHNADAWYHSFLLSVEGYTVLRTVWVRATMASGEKPSFNVAEVAQLWYDGKGNYVRINRTADMLPYGRQRINLHEEAEIQVNTMNALTARLTSEGVTVLSKDEVLKRGFDGDTHGWPVNTVIHRLYTDNRFECVWKLGGYRVLESRCSDELVEKYWKQVMMLLNSDKKDVYDIVTWCDYLVQVDRLHTMAVQSGRKSPGYDLNNRVYVLPEDLHAAHQRYSRLLQRKAEEARAAQRLQQDAERLPGLIEKDEKNFIDSKNCYFGIAYGDEKFLISTLSSINEYFEWGKALRHCVFHNQYWQKKDTLVLGVKEPSGRMVANAELDLNTGDILQCYGRDNVRPAQAEEIENLVKSHFGLYKKAKRNRKNVTSAPSLAPVFA